MRDVFYTLLVVWIIWRIMNGVNVIRTKTSAPSQPSQKREGETTVDFVPPKKKSVADSEGEYVDYEEIK
jgi:hypothetical protein